MVLMFRAYSRGFHTGCQESNLGLAHARQAPSPLCSHSGSVMASHQFAFFIFTASMYGSTLVSSFRKGLCVAAEDCRFNNKIISFTFHNGSGFWTNITCCQGHCPPPPPLSKLPTRLPDGCAGWWWVTWVGALGLNGPSSVGNATVSYCAQGPTDSLSYREVAGLRPPEQVPVSCMC